MTFEWKRVSNPNLLSILPEVERAKVQLWAATIAYTAHVDANSDGLFAAHNCNQCHILADRVKVWAIRRDYPGEV